MINSGRIGPPAGLTQGNIVVAIKISCRFTSTTPPANAISSPVQHEPQSNHPAPPSAHNRTSPIIVFYPSQQTPPTGRSAATSEKPHASIEDQADGEEYTPSSHPMSDSDGFQPVAPSQPPPPQPPPQSLTRNSSSQKRGHMACIECSRKKSKCERSPDIQTTRHVEHVLGAVPSVLCLSRSLRERKFVVSGALRRKPDVWYRNLIPATSVLCTTSSVLFASQNHHAARHVPQPESSAYNPMTKRFVRRVFLLNSQPVCLICVLRLTQQAQRSSIRRR